MENTAFETAWNNFLNYAEFDINAIKAENADIGAQTENDINASRGAFEHLFAGVKSAPGRDYDPCPIFPAVVHGIKQALGYEFCKAHPQEVSELFNALVNIKAAQEKETA